MGQKIEVGYEERDIDDILNYDLILFLNMMEHALRKRAQIAHQKIQILFNFPEVASFSMEHLREWNLVEFATVEDLLKSLIKDMDNINHWSVIANHYAWKISKTNQTIKVGQKIQVGHEEEDIDAILNTSPSFFLGILGHALRKRAQITHQKIEILFNFPEVTSFSMEHLRELGIVEFATVEDLLKSLIKDLGNINDWSVLANKYAWKIDEANQTTTTDEE